MRIALLKNNKIYNTDLPLKINGSFWIEDRDINNLKRNLLNIEAKDGKWYIKSNFDVKVLVNGQITEETPIDIYNGYEVYIPSENVRYPLYTMPVYDNDALELDVLVNGEIYIGNGNENMINYNNNIIGTKQVLLYCQSGKWSVKNLSETYNIYVNGVATKETNLEVGDVLFILGMKIIICGQYIIINNKRNIVNYNAGVFRQRQVSAPQKEEEEPKQIYENTDLKVYDKKDYFFRMPRFKSKFENVEVNIDPPPEQEADEEMPLAMTLGPMITMGITSMVSGLSAVSNVMSGTQDLKSALPSLLTCGAMLLSMIFWPLLQNAHARHQKKKKEKYRIKKYNEYIEERREHIRNIVTKQRLSLISNHIPLEECCPIIENRQRRLWERKIEHDDFLTLRLGVGNVEPFVKVRYPENHFTLNENNLRGVLDQLGEETKLMTGVPVAVSLTEKMITAVIGTSEVTKSFMEGLLLQTMTFHSYEDLKIVIMTNGENEKKWEFLKSSPYCWDDDKTIRLFSSNLDDANEISMFLDNILQNRKYEDGDTTKLNTADYKNYKPYFLIITDDYQTLRNIEIIKDVLAQKINVGFSMLIVQERLLGLPSECTQFLNINPDESAIYENELVDDKQQTFAADFIGNIDIRKLNKMIANIPIEMAKDRYALPNKLGFLEMFNVGKIEQLNIQNRWQTNNPIVSLQVPVGVDTNGELFKLDLHEKFHGPHGLVAGMTGSGKSEFIITYILSMAVNYNPDEVAFVLIDYKGGGLAGAFENKETGIKIPHLAGTITNLDVNDMKRSLASIESELKKRQSIFNEARQKLNESTIDIYKYQKLRREGKVEEAVPHLFIISDEFAELKSQQPEFMEQLISTARIGRSLGVHLILATQKPNGVVDDQIWSNTKFRVCLKVQDKADSMDMIRCPDAASLHNVGRFYLQVGYNEFFALGQSAYAGTPYLNTDKIKRKVDTNIDFINDIGYVIRSVEKEDDTPKTESYGEELSNIVKTLYDLGQSEKKIARQLWLDKIPEDIYVDDLEKKYDYKAEKCVINPVIGEYDDPRTQSQHLLTLPLSKEGNVIIYGAAGMGKEDLLSTIFYSTILKHTPEEINFYILDFGSETLKVFENIPHVGDVLLASETEKVNNLFKMLKDEVDSRKKLFAEFGGSYESYVTTSGKIVPTIVVAINLFEAFDESYMDLQDTFNILTREGSKYGIIFILTTNGVNFIRYKLKQNFKQNFVLQLNDETDYSDVVGNTHGLYPSKIKGRGLIKFKEIYEFQSAKYKTNGKNTEYIKKVGEYLTTSYKTRAPKVPVLPKIVNFDEVSSEIKGLDSIPVGIEKQSLNISKFDLRTKPITIVSSNEVTGFETFLPEFVKVCSHNEGLSINIIDAEKMFETEKFSCKYYDNDLDTIFNKIYTYVEKIYNAYVSHGYNVSAISGCQDLLVIIVGLAQLRNKLSDENQDRIENFMTMIKDLRKIAVVIMDTIDNIKQFEYENWYKTVVPSNHGIWIGDGIADQYTIKLSKNPKYIKDEIGNKFGYSIKKGNPIFIKLLTNATEEDEGDDNDE
ncbi:MAG: type VII secretion protein EssC [Bacilli bacterium]|nr:type VII secretion protein EssC [Bacilli bacterium]